MLKRIVLALALLGAFLPQARAEDYIQPALSPDPFTHVAFNFSTSGDHSLVAGVASKTTKVWGWTIVCASAVDVSLKDGSTVKVGPMPLGASDKDAIGVARITGTANTALNINLSGAVECGGEIVYSQN